MPRSVRKREIEDDKVNGSQRCDPQSLLAIVGVVNAVAIKLQTGSTINGRLLAQTAVNIAGATVTAP